MSFGEDVRKARMERGWSQQKLAEAVGTTQASINRLEQGQSERPRFAPEIAAVLDLELPISSGAKPRLIIAPTSDEDRYRREVPILLSAGLDDGDILVSRSISGATDAPKSVRNSPEAFALKVPNYEFAPSFEAGDIAIVSPDLPLVRDCDVLLCGKEKQFGAQGSFTARLRRLVDWDRETWIVRTWKGPDVILDRSDWPIALRVVARLNRE